MCMYIFVYMYNFVNICIDRYKKVFLREFTLYILRQINYQNWAYM